MFEFGTCIRNTLPVTEFASISQHVVSGVNIQTSVMFFRFEAQMVVHFIQQIQNEFLKIEQIEIPVIDSVVFQS